MAECKLSEVLLLPALRQPTIIYLRPPSSFALSVIIACLKKGYRENKRKNTFVATRVPAIDLSNTSNRIYFQFNGHQEEFTGGALLDTAVSKNPPRFRFGNGCVIDMKEQMQIGLELTGSMPVNENGALLSEGVPHKTITQRKDLHPKFYIGAECECVPYMNMDASHIVYHYIELWDNARLTVWENANIYTSVRCRSFESNNLFTMWLIFTRF